MSQAGTARAVVVTGASTGIGRAVTAKAAAQGARVFASVRKQEDADSLTAEFGAAVTPLRFDVADEAGVDAAAAQVAAALGDARLMGLVNNAGVAVLGPLIHLDTADLARQFDINLLGVHRVTKAFAPLLGADPARTGRPGRIVMMSSVGGRNANPFVGPYNASKFALEGYSTSLRRELMLHGIDVIVVGPGAIDTPIWDKNVDDQLSKYANTPYGPTIARMRKVMSNLGEKGLPASDVGDLVWQALTTARPKPRYSIVRTPFMSEILPRLLPARMVDRITARRLGFPKR